MQHGPRFLRRSATAAALGLMAGFVITTGSAWAACSPGAGHRPVCPGGATPEDATFIDPTASVPSPANVSLGSHTYVGPFATLAADSRRKIAIGEKSNVQDQVALLAARRGAITVGDEVILAHGAQVRGPATLGRVAVAGAPNAAFVGFNSLIDRGRVEHDAIVLHLARVGPGVTIKAGMVVLSGKNVTTQAQADNPALGKVVPITAALRAFMDDRTTFHALEHTAIEAHDDIEYGFRSLVHGGSSAATAGNAHAATVVGRGVILGDYAVAFRSVIGVASRIGCASLVDGSTLLPRTVIPSRRVIINRGHAGTMEYAVEWNPGCASDDDDDDD